MRTRLTTVLAATLLAALPALAGCGGTTSSTSGSTASFNDADVTFATDMVPHHAQALQMVEMTKGHALDPAVTSVVDGIEKAQTPEITQMKGWLKSWSKDGGRKVPSTGSSTMGGMEGGSMNGMMSASQMSRLGNTQDPAFQKMWLQLMVQHHQGAVSMAETEIAKGRNKDAVKLARSIVSSQKKEIATMQGLMGQ
jgi:uncharacterized protein (DUF305 family)